MKILLSLFLATTLLALTLSSAALAGGYKRINADELKAMLNDPAKEVIVDVREPWLFNKGHVPGATNIPYDESRERVLKELNPDDRIVFVCHGGPMGDELAELLIENGFKEVYNLIGGMYGWSGELEK